MLNSKIIRSLFVVLAGVLPLFAAPVAAQYEQVNLVSDIPGRAANTDPQLLNPWGVVNPPGGPLWVSDNNAGVSTLYQGNGTKQSLVVIIPTALTSASKHQQLGNIDWRMAASLIPLAVVGGFVGAALTRPLPAETLKKLFGGFMVLAGLRVMLFK